MNEEMLWSDAVVIKIGFILPVRVDGGYKFYAFDNTLPEPAVDGKKTFSSIEEAIEIGKVALEEFWRRMEHCALVDDLLRAGKLTPKVAEGIRYDPSQYGCIAHLVK